MKTRFFLAASAAFFMPVAQAASYSPTRPPGGLDTATVLYTDGASVGSLATYLAELETINSGYVTSDALTSALAGYLPLIGGTLTGDVTFSGKVSVPDLGITTNDSEAANTKFVATAVASETSARVTAEQLLSSAIATETTNRQSALSAVAAALNAETDARKSAVTDLTSTVAKTYAPLTSAALTGTPTAPTAKAGTDSTQLATTAYADAAVATEAGARETAEATLTSDLNAETKTRGDADTALTSSLSSEMTARKNADTTLSDAIASETDNRQTAISALSTTFAKTYAPLANAALTGVPTAPTAKALTNSTQLATTAYADAAVATEATNRAAALASYAATLPTFKVNDSGELSGETKIDATVTLDGNSYELDGNINQLISEVYLSNNNEVSARTSADETLTTNLNAEISNRETAISDVKTTAASNYAPLASAALTGTPTAPTAKAGTDSTQLATTAYADAAVATEATNRAAALSAYAATLPTFKVNESGELSGETPIDVTYYVNGNSHEWDSTINSLVDEIFVLYQNEQSARASADDQLTDKISKLNSTVAFLSGATFTGSVTIPKIYVSSASQYTSDGTTTYGGQGTILQWNTYQSGDGATEFINVVPSGISGAGFRWFSTHTGWTSATELARITESAFTITVPISAPSITLSSVATSNPGTGTHYACINDAGTLYRSDTACN